MRLSAALVGVASLVATAATVTNAFLINKQFYPAMVYITKSNASMSVIYIQALIVVYMMFQMLRKIFFGDLRAAEADHLSERAWHAVLETCLAFTVFRDDFSPVFVMQFVLLLFVKSFHWLADDRVDQMERSPVITIRFHLRMMAVIGFLGAIDSYLVSYAYFSILSKGASSQIVFGFEYAILMTMVIHVTLKYILHMHDLRTAQAWENKAVYLLYGELVINLLRCILYGMFAMIMMKLHTFPLFSIRPFYVSIRALHKAYNDVVLSRRAINAMNNLFPVVSTEELTSMDATCIICREEMTADAQPKRLPCSHVFHAHCLRSWFQRQQTCPTCRTDILGQGINGARDAAAARGAAQQQQAAVANGAANQPGAGQAGQNNFMPFVAHQFAFHAQLGGQNNQAAGGPAGAANGGANGAGAAPPQFAMPPMPPFLAAAMAAGGHAPQMPHPPMFMPPIGVGMFLPPPPPPPFPLPARPSFDGYSDVELRAMEGETRLAVESRLRALQNISTLLDAAGLQMQQYLNIVSHLPSIPNAPSTSVPGSSGAAPPAAPATPQPSTSGNSNSFAAGPSSSGGNSSAASSSTSGNSSAPSPPTTTTNGMHNGTPSAATTATATNVSAPSAPITPPVRKNDNVSALDSENEDSPSTSSSGAHSAPSPDPPTSGSTSPSADEIRQRRLRRFDQESNA